MMFDFGTYFVQIELFHSFLFVILIYNSNNVGRIRFTRPISYIKQVSTLFVVCLLVRYLSRSAAQRREVLRWRCLLFVASK